MNIIKLVDKIMPGNTSRAKLFNDHLRGKYAYWVHMRYIVPMGIKEEDGKRIGLDHAGYVVCERDITKLLHDDNLNPPDSLFASPYIDMDDHNDDIIEYIDMIETDLINSTKSYEMKNNYVPDSNITVDELKQFRTWLAKELLNLDSFEVGEGQKFILFNELEYHVLKYYANNMHDDTIKILSNFGSNPVTYDEYKNNCGCGSGTNLSSLYNTQLTTCDPINIYRKNLYSKMVELFSKVEFWQSLPKEFLKIIKSYIENIIILNLPLNISNFNSNFKDCTCMSEDTQASNINILKKLSSSLEYMINDDIKGHKNYIGNALKEWSSKLYENMQW